MLGERSAPVIQRVRGTTDVLPPEDARLRRLESRLRDELERFGYQGMQTPIIEPLELFLRKSGDEIVARMYSFSHWNRRLCLRPEVTASVIRAYVDQLQGHGLPLRVQYSGPIFRYERPSRGRSRQFTVLGLELIGASGAAADAEVLHLACAGLEAVGITRYRLVVGHLGATLQLLGALGMTDHAQSLVLDQMEPIARGRVDLDAAIARVAGLLGADAGHANGAVSELPPGLASLPQDQATAIAADILSRASLPVEGGARQPSAIIQRLLARARRPDPTDQVRTAFEFVAALHAAAGPPERLQTDLRSVLEKHGLSTEPADEVLGALDLLRAYGPLGPEVEVEVDLSLARGLRYYTGLVFEIYADSNEGPLQLCGGGRYDDLARALGGREAVPACGFQYGLERLDLIAPRDDVGSRRRVLVAGVTSADHPSALSVARELRTLENLAVEQDVRLRGVRSALRYADRAGIDLVVIVGERERQEGAVVVRDLRRREETRVPLTGLVDAVRSAVA
ncbi:MAG: histidine--tRNA ligase family protein [Chloroflexi bacterium]|nr:histidine--tRNA ligase family protein [Chloroflexota bacterium]MBV9595362.1 histidine--tRNA ligase family protein [Chloroflexota bacterium]